MELEKAVGLQKVSLRNLLPEMNNAFIIGIIIAKQKAKAFSESKQNDSDQNRAVWNFTMRDSVPDYINVTCWGSKSPIFELHDKYHIGDVVEVVRPIITIRKINDFGEKFRPMVTSPYALTLNENHSHIINHEDDANVFKRLLEIPTKPVAGAVTLADIHNSSNTNLDEFVDILGAVRSVGASRIITTRDGVELQMREVVVLDYSNSGLKIIIWDKDIIARAEIWRPRSTVLFMTDMKVNWSTFNRKMTASMTSRTVVTENPLVKEAESLRNYAQTVQLETSTLLDQIAHSIPDLNLINNVMTCCQILDKANSILSMVSCRPEDQQFTAVLYGFVMNLDLDGLSRVIMTKCKRCNSFIPTSVGFCDKTECSDGTQIAGQPAFETTFDLRLILTDHTGSLINCRLSGKTAESILNCTVSEFLQLTDDKKCELKWIYLLERCKIHIWVSCQSGRKPLISILSCNLASPTEVANKLPQY